MQLDRGPVADTAIVPGDILRIAELDQYLQSYDGHDGHELEKLGEVSIDKELSPEGRFTYKTD